MLLTNTGTITATYSVLYDKSEIQGTSKGESVYLYLDFVKNGVEAPTFSVSVKEANLGDNYFTLSSANPTLTQVTYLLGATGKYAINVGTGKNIEAVKVDCGLFTTSTLTVDFGLDSFYG